MDNQIHGNETWKRMEAAAFARADGPDMGNDVSKDKLKQALSACKHNVVLSLPVPNDLRAKDLFHEFQVPPSKIHDAKKPENYFYPRSLSSPTTLRRHLKELEAIRKSIDSGQHPPGLHYNHPSVVAVTEMIQEICIKKMIGAQEDHVPQFHVSRDFPLERAPSTDPVLKRRFILVDRGATTPEAQKQYFCLKQPLMTDLMNEEQVSGSILAACSDGVFSFSGGSSDALGVFLPIFRGPPAKRFTLFIGRIPFATSDDFGNAAGSEQSARATLGLNLAESSFQQFEVTFNGEALMVRESSFAEMVRWYYKRSRLIFASTSDPTSSPFMEYLRNSFVHGDVAGRTENFLSMFLASNRLATNQGSHASATELKKIPGSPAPNTAPESRKSQTNLFDELFAEHSLDKITRELESARDPNIVRLKHLLDMVTELKASKR